MRGGHLVRKEKASLCLLRAGSRFAACKQTWAHSVSPWAHSVSPLPQKILQEGCCSSCFQSSVAALTYQAQKRPKFVLCFQQESSHSSCYPSWSRAKGQTCKPYFPGGSGRKKGLLCATLAGQKRKELSCPVGFSLWNIPSSACSERLFIGKGWKMHLILKEDASMLQKERL